MVIFLTRQSIGQRMEQEKLSSHVEFEAAVEETGSHAQRQIVMWSWNSKERYKSEI